MKTYHAEAIKFFKDKKITTFINSNSFREFWDKCILFTKDGYIVCDYKEL